MDIAFDPDRVRRLAAHTVTAIDALVVIRSADPVAQDALAATRLLRRNLEDLWMPLLEQIESSTALVRPTDSAIGAIELAWGRLRGVTDLGGVGDRRARPVFPYADLNDDQLLSKIVFFDERAWLADTDDGTTRPPAAFVALAHELARRVRASPGFAARLLDHAPDYEVVTYAVGATDFPAVFLRDLAIVMLRDLPPVPDVLPTAERIVAYRQLLAKLADHPALCLEVLSDKASVYALSVSNLVDQSAVAALVTSGLHTAVTDDPTLLADGYRALRVMAELAGSELDAGFGPGLAQGTAASMIGYVDTLAPAIGKEDGGLVRVITFDTYPIEFDLGTYEEVRALFGAIARDGGAQTRLGVVLGAYTSSVVDGLRESVTTRSGVQHVAQFADLMGDAVTVEQGEMLAVAAAATTRGRFLADSVGFAVGGALAASGVGALASSTATRGVKAAATIFADVDADTMPNGALRHVAHDAIVVSVVTLARTDATARAAHRLHTDDHHDLRTVDDYLARIDECNASGDLAGYRREVSDMTAFIRARTPALDVFLTSVTDIAAVNALTEGHA